MGRGGGAGGKGQSSIDFIYFWGRIRSFVGRGNESKKRYGRAREAKTHQFYYSSETVLYLLDCFFDKGFVITYHQIQRSSKDI
jgi:hypothetical protein